MMSPILRALEHGQPLPGRHLVVTAHPDDETISCGALMSLAIDLRILQITDGVTLSTLDRSAVVATRARERAAALDAARWAWPVVDLALAGREAAPQLLPILDAIRASLVDVDVVWTHPYEGGHLDHDSAAAAVQMACAGTDVLRMEFASYHSIGQRLDVFGAFWSDPSCEECTVQLEGDLLARKRAAISAYVSQAHILRKFKDITREAYRVAPTYDFTQPVPPPACRWDVKRYQPSTADWRAMVADLAVPA